MESTLWKCGLSVGVRMITKETFEGFAKAGIDCMEVCCGYTSSDVSADYKQIKTLAKDFGVELWSYHIPFAPFEEVNIATLDSDFRKKSVELIKSSIDKAAFLETKVAVIHPSGEPNKPEDRQSLMESAKESLAIIAEYADKKGITVAVEDLPRTCLGNCSSDILELISADSRLRICFDANHLLEEKNVDFIKKCGSKIVTTHISDYDFLNERHWLPYEGKNDWVGIVSALENAGYCGPFLFEIGRNPPASISRRVLAYEDFYNGYRACVNKTQYEVFGVPVDEVCKSSAYFEEAKI